MADTNPIVTIDGRSGVVVPAMFDKDPKGTLGYLRHPYQDAVMAFQYDVTNGWTLERDIITYANHGNGETAEETGLSGTQDDQDTSFLKAGFPSGTSYFTVTGIALRPSTLPYAASITSGSLTSDLVVSRTGVARNDCMGIAGSLIKVLEGSYVEFFETGRKCFALIGKVEELPQAFGFASLNDVTNGLVGKCNFEKTRRPLIIPGSNGNNDSYNWRVTFGNKISIPADPSFAAPTAAAVCALKLTLWLEGYFSDASGAPLIQPGDVYEADIAAGISCS
jgi:hypothetical protein